MDGLHQRCKRMLGAALMVLAAGACGPVIAIDVDDGSSDDGVSDTPLPPMSTVTSSSTTQPPGGQESTDTGDETCEPIGRCPLCHEGFRLEFFPLGGLEARALLPTRDGGFVAVGTGDDPGAITWLDGRGNTTGQAGPYAEGLVLQSATWGPDGRLILAGNIEQELWVGIADASGTLLVEDRSQPHPFLPDIHVWQHDVRGFFVSAHLGSRPPRATGAAVLQFNHQGEWRHGFYSVIEPFDLDLYTRGGSALTSTQMLYALTKAPQGLRLLRRSAETPWNIVVPESVDVDVPGLPASITALHGDAIVTATNDEEAHLARVDDGEHVVWLRSISAGPSTRAHRVGFDAANDLIFVAGAVEDAAASKRLWIAALDEDGTEVWQWVAPSELVDASPPVLDVVGLPEGGAAVSTAGDLWYATVHPYGC